MKSTRLHVDRPNGYKNDNNNHDKNCILVKKDSKNHTAYKLQGKKQLEESRSVTIYGLGAAILAACQVALWIEKHVEGNIQKIVNTGTTEVLDELKDTEGKVTYRRRYVSTIHIELSRS